MSENIQEGRQTSQVSGLGLALRQGRESKGYTVERVADELHLRPSIVIAMEEENYELLPGDIFLKGYIRSFARLVSINENEVVQMLERHQKNKADLEANTKQTQGKEKRKKHSKFAMVLLIIAVILGAALYYWTEVLGNGKTDFVQLGIEPSSSSLDNVEPTALNANIDNASDVATNQLSADQNLAVADQADSEPVASSAELETDMAAVTLNASAGQMTGQVEEPERVVETADITSTEPSASNQPPLASGLAAAPLGEARLGEIQEPVTPVVEKSIDQSSIAEDQAVEAAVNEGENTSSESTSIESVGNAQDPVPVIPLEQGSISVVFSGECWFTLKNGEGKTVIADLKKAGDEISYTGALPFNVVVGAVSEVTVIFEDELIDFSTVRVRNNRASLELTHLN